MVTGAKCFCPKEAIRHVAHTFCRTIRSAVSRHKGNRGVTNDPCEEAAQVKALFDSQGPPINPSIGEIIKMNHMQSSSKSHEVDLTPLENSAPTSQSLSAITKVWRTRNGATFANIGEHANN